LQGIALTEVNTNNSNFAYDRIIMICKPNGKFITARQHPELLKMATSIIDDKIYISLPNQ